MSESLKPIVPQPAQVEAAWAYLNDHDGLFHTDGIRMLAAGKSAWFYGYDGKFQSVPGAVCLNAENFIDRRLETLIVPQRLADMAMRIDVHEGAERTDLPNVEVRLYRLADFDRLVEETMQALMNLHVGHALREPSRHFDDAHVLQMFKKAVRGTGIGPLFDADRNAARLTSAMSDARDEEVPSPAIARRARL